MELKEVEVFSTVVNAAVVRMPRRRFPGVVIQGDSLSILRSDVLVELVEKLAGYLAVYEETLRAHGMALPHGVPTKND